MEKTLAIIKPDAVSKGLIGDIINMILSNGLDIVAMKMVHLTVEKAKGFYIVHEDRPFYDGLVDFMCSGPVVVMVLAGEDAILKYRNLFSSSS